MFIRNLATDNVPKLPMADRWGLPPLFNGVVQGQGILIAYSNEIDAEVNLNYTLPNGDKSVWKCRLRNDLDYIFF